MNARTLYQTFKGMFPDIAEDCNSYKRMGSRAIAVYLKSGKSLIFMYTNENNWNLGTKYWRKMPSKTPKGGDEK